jgi:hypothetical protein
VFYQQYGESRSPRGLANMLNKERVSKLAFGKLWHWVQARPIARSQVFR